MGSHSLLSAILNQWCRFFSAEVWLTTFLVMVIPFALALGLGDGPLEFRSGGAVAAGMMLVCLLTTQSRAGLVGLVGELWVIAWFICSVSARIVAVIVTVGVVAVIALVFSAGATGVRVDFANALPIKQSASSAFHRFEIWGFAMSEIANHWLVGIGYGNLSYLFSYGQDPEVVMPGHYAITHAGAHNILLYLALHVGIPGLLLFGWLMVRAMRTTAAAYRHAQEWRSKAVLLGTLGSVVGLMLRLQFDQMLVGTLAIFFWVLLALAVLSYPSCDERAKDSCARKSGVVVEV